MEEILRQGRARYPAGAGGVLLGQRGDSTTVEASRPGRPVAAGACAVPPVAEVREAEAAGAAKGLAAVGVWHSHPDGSAEPTPADVAGAPPGLVFLVVSIRGGLAAEWACWVPREGGKSLVPVIVRLMGS